MLLIRCILYFFCSILVFYYCQMEIYCAFLVVIFVRRYLEIICFSVLLASNEEMQDVLENWNTTFSSEMVKAGKLVV